MKPYVSAVIFVGLAAITPAKIAYAEDAKAPAPTEERLRIAAAEQCADKLGENRALNVLLSKIKEEEAKAVPDEQRINMLQEKYATLAGRIIDTCAQGVLADKRLADADKRLADAENERADAKKLLADSMARDKEASAFLLNAYQNRDAAEADLQKALEERTIALAKLNETIKFGKGLARAKEYLDRYLKYVEEFKEVPKELAQATAAYSAGKISSKELSARMEKSNALLSQLRIFLKQYAEVKDYMPKEIEQILTPGIALMLQELTRHESQR